MNYLLGILLVAAAPALPPGGVDRSMIIVTTEDIRQRSARLADFVTEKERRGFRVRIATEADFGGAGITGLQKALLIRQWLTTVQHEYSFVLLIGDAHPQYGEVPMVTVWPRHTYPPDNCVGFGLDCRSLETDYLYADLSGSWDLNGNGLYGETEQDEGPGGIDFEAELYVGRIPVYFDNVRELDRVLAHAMQYMAQTTEEAVYRQRMLLPAAMLYFQGQQLIGYSFPENVDSANDVEWFVRNVLSQHPQVDVTRLYEQGGIAPSLHAPDLPLTRETLLAEWASGYGMVFWFGHGLDRQVARTVWQQDSDGDSAADADEIESVVMLHADDAVKVGGDQGAFVVGVSCEVGSAETPYNLAYSLLLEGGSVGIIASTNVTPLSGTDTKNLEAEMNTTLIGADNVGYVFFDRLLDGAYAGQAFYQAKYELGQEGEIEPNAGKMMLTYFGDPSLTLASTIEEVKVVETPSGDSNDGGCRQGGSDSAGWLPLLLAALLLLWRRKSPGHEPIHSQVKAE